MRVRGVQRITSIGGLLVMAAAMSLAQSADRPDFTDEAKLRQYLTATAERVLLPPKCGECHKSEFQGWETTRHATQFQDLHTTDAAKKIYTALGLRLIRRATDERTPACLQCHYTPEITPDGLRATISVGCESCHGPARDWINIHNNYGVRESDFQKAVKLETPEHRLQRIADSKAKGMRRPSEIYEVAANCFGCHTVPYEDLINRGGHSSGSDFELVNWSQKIRHNFLQSFLTGDGKANAETPPERKRLMFVAGRALALEYSLRGLAVATKDDNYFAAMNDRSGYAVDALIEVNERAPIPEIAVMLDAFKNVAIKPNNRAQLIAAADRIGQATKQFLARADPTKLTSVDALLKPASARAAASTPAGGAPAAQPVAAAQPPAPATPDKPQIAPESGGGVPPTASIPPTAAATSAPGGAATSTGVAATTSAPPGRPSSNVTSSAAPANATASPAASGGPRVAAVAGEPLRRPPWRSEPTHGFLQEPCATCHDPQVRWWRADAHSKAVLPFRNGDARPRQIAAAYGINPDEINQGDQICMACHGTVLASPTARVRAGVGCQQCHGPGEDYKESHQKNRQEALAAGLVDLLNPAVRARACADCHYITEPRLVAAGHTTGEDFRIDAAVAQIKHWGPDFKGRVADIAAPQLTAAYTDVVAKRGPAPRVARTSPTGGAPPASAAAAGTTPASPATTGATREPSFPARGVPSPATGEPASGRASTATLPPSGTSASSITPGVMTPSAGVAAAQNPTSLPNAASTDAVESGTRSDSSAARTPASASSATTPGASGRSGAAIAPSPSVEEILLQLKVRLERLYGTAGKPGGS